VLATGHYRNGVLLSPITADVIAELLDSGQLPALAAPFTLDRFGEEQAWR
jgi:glycine oxidase